MAARGLGGLGGSCGTGARTGTVSCWAGCGADVVVCFGIEALAGNPAGTGFDNEVWVLGVKFLELKV